jgi:hypothetical protein
VGPRRDPCAPQNASLLPRHHMPTAMSVARKGSPGEAGSLREWLAGVPERNNRRTFICRTALTRAKL